MVPCRYNEGVVGSWGPGIRGRVIGSSGPPPLKVGKIGLWGWFVEEIEEKIQRIKLESALMGVEIQKRYLANQQNNIEIELLSNQKLGKDWEIIALQEEIRDSNVGGAQPSPNQETQNGEGNEQA